LAFGADLVHADAVGGMRCESVSMAGVRPFASRRFRGRRYCVLIEMTYAGGRLDDDRRQMLTAEVKIPGARADRDLVVTMSPDAISIVTEHLLSAASSHVRGPVSIRMRMPASRYAVIIGGPAAHPGAIVSTPSSVPGMLSVLTDQPLKTRSTSRVKTTAASTQPITTAAALLVSTSRSSHAAFDGFGGLGGSP
jgi:hypothetical protein